MDRFSVQPAANLESCESLKALVRAILDEKVDTADMVVLAKEWHKKVGVCEDIQSCGCCGVRDFQQVKEVEVSKLDLLRLDTEQISCAMGFPLSIASMPRSLNKTHGYIGCTMILYLMV